MSMRNRENNDPDPATPGLDQAQAAMMFIARTWGLMYSALIKEGVPPDKATAFMVTYIDNNYRKTDQDQGGKPNDETD